MPYIKQERRIELDEKMNELFHENLNVGELNYVISRLIKNLMNKNILNYQFCNGIIGVLECAKQEFYNRVVSPYETVKISENGDLYNKR